MTSTTNSPRIVLAAATDTLRQRLVSLFEATTYRVHCVDSAEDARRALSQAVFELVVFAATDHDAAGEIASLCAATTTPVLVLTASSGDEEVVRALDAGAADAIPYPHLHDVLLARLRLALRRLRSLAAQRATRFGDLKLDLDAGTVHLGELKVDVTRIEYRLLVELMVAGGRVVPHGELLQRIWGAIHPSKLNDLRVHVTRLRRKIESGASNGVNLVSIPSVGYRIVLREEQGSTRRAQGE